MGFEVITIPKETILRYFEPLIDIYEEEVYEFLGNGKPSPVRLTVPGRKTQQAQQSKPSTSRQL